MAFVNLTVYVLYLSFISTMFIDILPNNQMLNLKYQRYANSLSVHGVCQVGKLVNVCLEVTNNQIEINVEMIIVNMLSLNQNAITIQIYI